ncbi:MAG TPA: membrane protein insertion efficiency factor YidD [Terriglobales bacterium]|nr:membrane protein insertion efficiency factor YidD [Terriglobales bacterium]
MSDIGKNFGLLFLRAYKQLISPMMGPACRYVPTCSEYAMEAVERYGLMVGGVKAVWRLLRCHPFAKGGYDPVAKSADVRATVSASGEFCSH